MKRLWNRTLGLTAVAGLFVIATPMRPADANNQFRECTEELLRSGISRERASTACSAALKPQELSQCVFGLQSSTPVAAENALSNCFRVRRPLDLGRCVYRINRKTAEADPNAVLGYCRRSLLPTRFSECVVGLSSSTELTSTRAMRRCIKAEESPLEGTPE
ncbi:MAG: hypothetical protein BRC44_12670 [Cyanobacteria bacterium QS_4_48_99]|nr:MAG: hypothetical protein BRC44_12670 [Cyanobacteria bacterium QS_4_48_99]